MANTVLPCGCVIQVLRNGVEIARAFSPSGNGTFAFNPPAGPGDYAFVFSPSGGPNGEQGRVGQRSVRLDTFRR